MRLSLYSRLTYRDTSDIIVINNEVITGDFIMKNTRSVKALIFAILVMVSSLSMTGCQSKQNKQIEVDINDFISYEVVGADGSGTVYSKIDYDGLSEYIYMNLDDETISREKIKTSLKNSVDYQYSDNDDLENGDKITIQWNVKEDSTLKECNVKINCNDKEITVSGLGRYVEKASELPQEILERMDNEIIEAYNIQFYSSAGEDEVVDSLEVVNRLFLYDEDSSSDVNKYIVILKATVSNSEIQGGEYYYFGIINNILIDDDNAIMVDLENYTIPEDETFEFKGDGGHYYIGYESKDDLYSRVVGSNYSVEECTPQ